MPIKISNLGTIEKKVVKQGRSPIPEDGLFTFCNIIMTGKHMHTTSKGRVVPQLMFSFEHVPQQSITENAKRLLISFDLLPSITMKNTMRNTSVINPVTTENTEDSHYKCREVINTWN